MTSQLDFSLFTLRSSLKYALRSSLKYALHSSLKYALHSSLNSVNWIFIYSLLVFHFRQTFFTFNF